MSLKVIELDNRTWRIEDGFVYCYLLEGSKNALLIDSGFSGENIKELVETITNKPVILANTHGDMDHVAGNKFFDKFYIHPEDVKRCNIPNELIDKAHIDIKEGFSFDLGDRLVTTIDIPGHTYGSVAFLDETKKMLFSGDTVSDAIIFLFGAHRCPEEYEKSLKKLIDFNDSFESIHAAHGTPTLNKEYIELVLEGWKLVLEGCVNAVDEDVHGYPVRTYKLDNCGFYVERK